MAHPCQTKQQELESFLINVEETNLQIQFLLLRLGTLKISLTVLGPK